MSKTILHNKDWKRLLWIIGGCFTYITILAVLWVLREFDPQTISAKTFTIGTTVFFIDGFALAFTNWLRGNCYDVIPDKPREYASVAPPPMEGHSMVKGPIA
jgi:hypothetical protein